MKVFLSSTYSDLVEHRRAAIDAIERLGQHAVRMEIFGARTEDEVFISYEAAKRGVKIENTGSEPLVGLRYFGPDVHANLPKIGGK